MLIALDDFGVGFSSLSQIRDLPPVDVIKVDRSFTAGLGSSESDGALVAAVLSLARSLGLIAVAEGVETADQHELLNDLGCNVGQGFYFSRPQALRCDRARTRRGYRHHHGGRNRRRPGRRLTAPPSAVVTPLITRQASIARAPTAGPASAPAERDLDERLFIACGLAWVTGLIHAEAAIQHVSEYLLYSLFFVLLAATQ